MKTMRRAVLVSALGAFAFGGCSRVPDVSTSSPEALRAYREGVTHLERFYYREAVASFDRAIAADSLFALPWLRKAEVASMSGDEPTALRALDRALALAPRATPGEQLLVRMWNSLIRYQTTAAAAAAESLLALQPRNAEAWYFRGMIAERNKDLDGAIKWYQKAIDADSGYALAVMSQGYAYSNTGEHEKAIRQMEKYIRLAPGAADPRASLADLFVRVGRYDEALEQYRKSLELKPDYWYAVQEIGTVYLILGRLREAGDQFSRALKLLPTSPALEAVGLSAEGLVSLARRNYDEAARQFREALTRDVLSGKAAFGLVFAESKRKHFADAELVAEGIRREFERRNMRGTAAMSGFFLMFSRLRMEEGRLEEAAALCDSALAYSVPLSRGEVFRQLAEIRLRERAYENALAACEEALRFRPNSPEVLLTLLRVYHATGDRRMTAELGERLRTLWKDADPDFAAAKEVNSLLQ